MMKKKALALLAAVMMLGAAAFADTVEDRGLDLLGSSVHYPYLTEASEEVNALLVEQAGVGAWLDRMAMLTGSADSIQVSYDVRCNQGGIFSCVFAAEGALETSRGTWRWQAVTVDTEAAQAVAPEDIFADLDGAKAWIEDYLEERVAPELSPNLEAREVTPLPECFAIDEAGITFFYPVEQLRWLSDRAGSVQLAWYELRPWLRLEEGSVLDRIGVNQMLGAVDPEGIAEWLEAGTLPGLPVVLGGSVQAATDTWKMLNDNDMIPGARIFELEDAAFRDVDLLTDTLTDDWVSSIILGIRSERINFCGLITGETESAAWRGVLGTPDATLVLDEEAAEDNRTVPGESDYYTIAGKRLRLHADADGVLAAVYISE